jgi:hypothetical protein
MGNSSTNSAFEFPSEVALFRLGEWPSLRRSNGCGVCPLLLSGERPTILFAILQLAVFLLIAGYLCRVGAGVHRRNERSWSDIVLRLVPGSGADPGADTAAKIDRCFSRAEIETRASTTQGLRRLFRDAGLMLEMADYAERHGGIEVRALVASLRSHAMAIRVGVVMRLLSRGK